MNKLCHDVPPCALRRVHLLSFELMLYFRVSWSVHWMNKMLYWQIWCLCTTPGSHVMHNVLRVYLYVYQLMFISLIHYSYCCDFNPSFLWFYLSCLSVDKSAIMTLLNDGTLTSFWFHSLFDICMFKQYCCTIICLWIIQDTIKLFFGTLEGLISKRNGMLSKIKFQKVPVRFFVYRKLKRRALTFSTSRNSVPEILISLLSPHLMVLLVAS